MMRHAKEFRDTAWNTLRGKYWWAVLAALIAVVLGGAAGQNPLGFSYDLNMSHVPQQMRELFQGHFQPEILFSIIRPFAGIATVIGSFAFVYGVGLFIVGSAVELGYDRFFISLYESKDAPKIEMLFSRFAIFGNALLLRVLMAVKILLWSLLLVVPGIIAAYRYAMAPYLLAEQPELTPAEAIERSKEMMEGNKGRMFCLHFSFIGWFLLAGLTWGIGFLFLAPYVKAAETAFYLELSGRLPLPGYVAAPAAPAAGTTAAPQPGEGEINNREFV